MTTMKAIRENNGLFNTMLFLIGLTFMITWLPMVRSLFDGVSYQWGTNYFGRMISGKGITPAYLFLVTQLLFYALLFISFYWIKNRMFNHILLAIWWIHIFGNLLFELVSEGNTMFHGDTMNVHVSLSAIVIPLSVLALILLVLAIRRDQNSDIKAIPWSKRNKMLAWITFGPLPIQAILLATGEPHGITDQIGVIISILQCFMIPFVVRPYQRH